MTVGKREAGALPVMSATNGSTSSHRLLPWFLWAQLLPAFVLGGRIGWTAIAAVAIALAAALLIGRSTPLALDWLGLGVPQAGWWAAASALLLPAAVWPRWIALPFHLLFPETAMPIYEGGGFGFALAAVLLVPFMEEVLYRGLLLGALRQYGRWPAIIASALLFGLGHGLTLAFSTFVVGWVLGWLACEYRSIWPGFIVHASFNLFAAVGAWTLPDEIAGPSGAPALLVMLIILTATARATRRGWPLIKQIFAGPWRERKHDTGIGRQLWQIMRLWPVAVVALMWTVNLMVSLLTS